MIKKSYYKLDFYLNLILKCLGIIVLMFIIGACSYETFAVDLTDSEQRSINEVCEGSNLSYSSCGDYQGIFTKINTNNYEDDFNEFKEDFTKEYEEDFEDLEDKFDKYKTNQREDLKHIFDSQDDNFKRVLNLERNMSKNFLELENKYEKEIENLKDYVDNQDKKVQDKIIVSNSTVPQSDSGFNIGDIPKLKFETKQYAKLDKYVDGALYGEDGNSQVQQSQQSNIDLTAYALRQDLPFWNFIFIWFFIIILIVGLVLTNVYWFYKSKEFEIPQEVKKTWAKKLKEKKQ